MKKQPRLLLLVPLVLLLFSWNIVRSKKEDHRYNISLSEEKPVTKKETNDSDTTLTLKKVLKTLEKATSLDSPAVGWAGATTAVYKSYQWLCKNASIAELEKLTESPYPYIRTYAFLALCKKGSVNLVSIMKHHLNDTTEITLFSGCSKNNCQVRHVWLERLKKAITPAEFKLLVPPSEKNEIRQSFCLYPDWD